MQGGAARPDLEATQTFGRVLVLRDEVHGLAADAVHHAEAGGGREGTGTREGMGGTCGEWKGRGWCREGRGGKG